VNGSAVGAGMNLALACDVRIAGRRARFEPRFLDLALHPGGGHTWMLRNLLGPQGAAAMIMFGEALDGEAAAKAGLAWRCVDDDALLEEAIRLASRAASVPPQLLRRLKEVMSGAAAVSSHSEAVEQEVEPQAWSIRQPAFTERLAALRRRISTDRS
jgi:enoyl-CoA hydratase